MTSFARLATLAATLCTCSAFAEVHPNPLFSEHAVLQSGMAVPVWGIADPGEKITVTVNGSKASTVAASDGKWMVHLPKLKPGGPFTMTVFGEHPKSASQRGAAAVDTLSINDVLVGEVWLGSGQSNMEFPVSRAHAYYAGMLDEEKEIAAANYPQLRMFKVKDTKSYTPLTTEEGEWQVCTPAVVGDWSAVGYLFGRDLQQALHLPVGIVISAYGASTAEAWLPRQALVSDPTLDPMLQRFDARETFFRDHPGASEADAPGAPQTINARPGRNSGPMRDPVQDQHQPTVLYNGMIAPILPYAIRGAIWYQGESIVGGSAGVQLYGHVMETLVTDWRKEWGEGNFPFYAVQLAALNNVSNNPAVREQQAKILSLPNTGLAITIDIGDPANVHPKNKEPLGQRLADLALANVYEKKLDPIGPTYAGMKIEGSAIRIRFTHAQGLKSAPTPNQLAGVPLTAPPPPPRPAPNPDGSRPTPPAAPLTVSHPADPAVLADASAHLHGFQIAGADGKFLPAEAKIEGDSVLVSSPEVPNPVAVRYAWENYPAGGAPNLYNAANLPAAPFRTDTGDAVSDVASQFTAK